MSDLAGISSDHQILSNTVRITRLEDIVLSLQTRLDNQAQSNSKLADGLHEVVDATRSAREQFQVMLAEQEARWTKAHKELTETAIEMMEQAMLQAFARKLIDWAWTVAFSACLIGLGWLATHIGVH